MSGLDLAGYERTDGVALGESGPAFALFDDYTSSYDKELMYLDVFQ